jgi:hypothetical protein
MSLRIDVERTSQSLHSSLRWVTDIQIHRSRLHIRGLGFGEAEEGAWRARSRGEGALGECCSRDHRLRQLMSSSPTCLS